MMLATGWTFPFPLRKLQFRKLGTAYRTDLAVGKEAVDGNYLMPPYRPAAGAARPNPHPRAVMASGFITHHLYQRQVSKLYDPDSKVRHTAITALVQDGRLQAIDQLENLLVSNLGLTEWGSSIAEEARKALQVIKSWNQLSRKDQYM
jgi:hypothetical protein